MKEAGSAVFKFKNYEEYFVIPISLNNFFIKQKETNSNIKDFTKDMKFAYPKIESIQELKGVGSRAKTSGSTRKISGSSANSSSMEKSSSGSSPKSSGGSYGSSN
ncbi:MULTISPECIES: hypothetical protein [unclassified Gilliamella]|uniref:hypothetical protein n=1 Tax=unclassified Gilliamella TaxID=2685620 RepID=UPI0013060E6D|nr:MULTISPECIES: hypothetical protein [unclassified Gilliamella]MWP50290.1 hypothetical protein [Gilliamella sp. Lep-s35]MWP69972.1 hypothetical protein [Gilliamella sp. Lep-s5]MWP76798.1 hypothetical protein [Gilliamella sp. Lep-s21]